MATTSIDPALAAAEPPRLPLGHRIVSWIRDHTLAIYAGLALAYMFLPVAVVVLLLMVVVGAASLAAQLQPLFSRF